MGYSSCTKRFAFIAAVVVSLCTTAGCASTGTANLSDAALSGDPEAMWTEGQELSREGERLVKRGEQRMADARRQVREGEDMIRKGNERVAQVRQAYEDAAANTGGATSSKAVADEARKLKAIGKRWEDAIDSIRAGNKLVEEGNANLRAAHSEIGKGRSMIESGSVLMRNSERTRRGVELLPTTVDTDDTRRR